MEWNPKPVLGTLDMCVFGVLLGVPAIIGCYFGCCSGRKQTPSEYLMGGKSMPITPIALSLIASCISGITVLGVPSEVYRYGTQSWLVIVSVLLISLIAAVAYVPVYVELNLDSCYQYLELRFNKTVQRLASFMFVLSQILLTPIVIYVPALAFSQVTGIEVHHITPVTCLVCIFYTTLGGMRGVVWTDTLQTVLMFAATIVVLVMGTAKVGGWSEVWRRSEEGHRLEFFNFDPDPLMRHTFWTVLFGTFFQELGRIVTNQGMVQRLLAVPTLKAARWTLLWFGCGFAAIKIIVFMTGLLMFAYYFGCDPLTSQRVERPDQLLPLLVLETTGHLPGLNGLFLAGVFSAALSTMSTSLNAMSGVLVNDLLRFPTVLSEGTWLRLAAAISGFLCGGLVFLVERLGGVLQVALSLNGITNGAMFGIFTLGMFFPRATSKGALAGAAASLVLVGALVFTAQAAIASGALIHHPLPASVDQCPANMSLPVNNSSIPEQSSEEVWAPLRLSYMYYSPLGTLIVLLVGLPVSLCYPEHPQGCHPHLVSPLVRPLCTQEISAAEAQPFNCGSLEKKCKAELDVMLK